MIALQQNETKFSETAQYLKAIAHPARIKILSMLKGSAEGKMTVTAIQEKLGVSQPETSRHLLIMRGKGIVRCSKTGPHVFYFLNTQNTFIAQIVDCLTSVN